MKEETECALDAAGRIVASSRKLIAFTGAGISVESGLPSFRGKGGLWEKFDPGLLDIGRFTADPKASWIAIRELFYAPRRSQRSVAARPEPNAAHRVLAEWEKAGLLSIVVTQNIDGLHTAAGSTRVAEFHGSIRELLCLRCGARFRADEKAIEDGLLDSLPPRCDAPSSGNSLCGGVLKPDFVFFGEAIPTEAYASAFASAASADVCLIIGSTGVVNPAAEVPFAAKRAGATVIEIDPGDTDFTDTICTIHIRLGASEALTRLDGLVRSLRAT